MSFKDTLEKTNNEWEKQISDLLIAFAEDTGVEHEPVSAYTVKFLQLLSSEHQRLREEIEKEQKEWESELRICRDWVKKAKESMDRSRKMFNDIPDDGELWAATEQLNLAHGNLQALSDILKLLE